MWIIELVPSEGAMSDCTRYLRVSGISKMKVGFASNDWSRSVVDLLVVLLWVVLDTFA